MIRKTGGVLVIALVIVLGLTQQSPAGETYRIAWSHHTGWEPWEYIRQSGILDRWAAKYAIAIQFDLVDDYLESINLYTGGTYHGCAMTNMDALTIPALGGVDSTALIVGGFSSGNDGIVMKKGAQVKDLKGREVKLAEMSVSHYLLTRALEMHKMKESDLTLVDTSDADIAAVFADDKNGAVVSWNPSLMRCRKEKDAKVVFDSSMIPGEIIGLLVVRSDAPDSLKKALTGAWYEGMRIISGKTPDAERAIAIMAASAGSSPEEFKAQLKTTAMFYQPGQAADFAAGRKLQDTMEYVRSFSFAQGLFGDAESKDLVGIEFPDGSVAGSRDNVQLRFSALFMRLAAEGKL